MIVHVTQADIDQQTGACPITYALTRRGLRNVTVGHYRVQIGRAYYLLPPDARAWLTRYDAGQRVPPILFELHKQPVNRAADSST